MVNTFGTALAVCLFFAYILLTPVLIEAQNLADHDAKEIADSMLTEPALAKYTQAVHKLQPLMAQLAQECDRKEGSTSLNDMATRMDGVSGVKPALKAAGMTSREYLVFSWSVFQSGMAVLAVQQPGGKLPPGVKMANVNFYRTHEAELTKKLGELTTHADCDNR